ncbi:MAG: Tetratricopeptide repeat [Chthonomonadaceae bacterium]|nr:Tetratricopeptide repeat [Chthonomonadaceae bacterium]
MSSQKQTSNTSPVSRTRSPRSRLLLLFCCLAGGAVAVVFLSSAVRDYYRPGSRYFQEGVDALARKNPMEAEQKWRKGVEEDPTYAANSEQLGDLYTEERRYAEAAAAYSRAVKLTPNDGTLLLRLARAEHLIDRDDLAYPHSKRAAEMLPEDADAQARYGLLAHQQGHDADAISPLQKALAAHPGVSDIAEALVDAQFATHDLVGAERTDEEWLNKQPNDPFAILWRAKIALQKPTTLENSRIALEAAEKAYKALPDNLAAHSVLGQVYLNLNRPADARKVYQDGVDIFPFAIAMLQGLVNCYARLGDTPHLQQVAARLKELNMKLDRLDHVREVVILHHGKDLESNFQLAQLESDVGHFPEAQKYFDQLKKDAPNDKRIQAAAAAFQERARQYLQGKVRVLP